jgi:lysophosphatidylglycerol acyltransferase 1
LLLCFAVVEIGDDIRTCLEDRTLVIANHQSTADVPLLMATFNTKKNVLPNLMWIMDRIFKYTNFGIVSILHEDFFIVSVSYIACLYCFQSKG